MLWHLGNCVWDQFAKTFLFLKREKCLQPITRLPYFQPIARMHRHNRKQRCQRGNFVAKSADFPDNLGDFNCPKQAATNRTTFSGFWGNRDIWETKWCEGSAAGGGAAVSPPQSHSTLATNLLITFDIFQNTLLHGTWVYEKDWSRAVVLKSEIFRLENSKPLPAGRRVIGCRRFPVENKKMKQQHETKRICESLHLGGVSNLSHGQVSQRRSNTNDPTCTFFWRTPVDVCGGLIKTRNICECIRKTFARWIGLARNICGGVENDFCTESHSYINTSIHLRGSADPTNPGLDNVRSQSFLVLLQALLLRFSAPMSGFIIVIILRLSP